MRKLSVLVLSVLMTVLGTGCIIVATDRCHTSRLCGNKRLVNIDGDMYVIDLDAHTVKKADEEATTVHSIEIQK